MKEKVMLSVSPPPTSKYLSILSSVREERSFPLDSPSLRRDPPLYTI